MEANRARYDHEIQVEAIRAHAAEVVAQDTVTAEAYRARALAAVIGSRTAIPDVDLAGFALSPGARAALENWPCSTWSSRCQPKHFSPL